MTRGSRCLRLALLTLVLWWGNHSTSLAATPMQQIKETIDRILEALHDPASTGEAKRAERRAKLRLVLLPRFDFSEMAKRSLGGHWESQDGRRGEFVSVFTDFVESSYISKVESMKDEKIAYIGERVDKNLAEVETEVVPSEGNHLSIDYKLHLVKREWKVYDIVVDNISMVKNYRSQFDRIITKTSFDELIRKLQEKGSKRGS